MQKDRLNIVWVITILLGAFYFLGLPGKIKADTACAPYNCPDGSNYIVDAWSCGFCDATPDDRNPATVEQCCDKPVADIPAVCQFVNLGGWPNDLCGLNGATLESRGCEGYTSAQDDNPGCSDIEASLVGCCPGSGTGDDGGGEVECQGSVPVGGCTSLSGCGSGYTCDSQCSEDGCTCGCRRLQGASVQNLVWMDVDGSGTCSSSRTPVCSPGDLSVYSGSRQCDEGDVEVPELQFRTISSDRTTTLRMASETTSCREFGEVTYPVWGFPVSGSLILQAFVPEGYEVVDFRGNTRCWDTDGDGEEPGECGGCVKVSNAGLTVPPSVVLAPNELFCDNFHSWFEPTYIPRLVIRQGCNWVLDPPTNLRISSATEVVNSEGVNRICSITTAGPTLVWTAAANASSYIVTIDNTATGAVVVNGAVVSGTSFNIPVVLAAGNYRARVWSGDVCGNTSATAVVYNFTVVNRPAPVVGTDAGDNIDSILINWRDGSTNEIQFQLFRRLITAGAFVNVYNVSTSNMVGTGNLYTYSDPGVPAGTYFYCPRAYAGTTYPSACQYSIDACDDATIVEYESWFSVKGSGIISANDISIDVPPNPSQDREALPNPIWIRAGDSLSGIEGFPGVAYSKNYPWLISVDDYPFISIKEWIADVSPDGWVGQDSSGVLDRNENTYSFIRNRVINRISPDCIEEEEHNGDLIITDQNSLFSWINDVSSDSIDSCTAITTWVTPSPVAVLYVNNGNLTLDTAIDMGNRRAVIFVDGTVTINDEIEVDTGAGGFLAIIAGGDLSIDGSIGEEKPAIYPYQVDITDPNELPIPHITAILYSGGMLSTGDSERQLKISGSLVGMGEVILGRTSVGPYPAEFVDFNPYLTKTLRDVGLRRVVRQYLVSP